MEVIPTEWESFLTAVNDAYYQMDTDREMLEHSLELSSQELIQANADLSLLFERNPTGIMIVEKDSRKITYVNSTASNMVGLPAGNIVGKVCHRFVCPAEKNRCPVMDLKQPVDISERILMRHDGSTLPILKTVVSIKTGDRECLLESFVDITTHKDAEKKLKESEEIYRTLAENAPLGIYYSDFYGTFLYGNKKAEELVGYSREELIGKNFLKLKILNPAGLARAAQLLVLNKLGMATDSDEFILTRKDGSKVQAEINTVLATIAGKKVVLGMVRDITARKHAEASLRESEEKYRSILESIEDSYFETDIPGNLTFFNPAACKAMGYSPDKLKGKNYKEILDEANAKRVRRAFIEVYQAGKTAKFLEFEIIKENGTRAYAETSISLIKDKNDTPIGFRGVGRDITERKEAEKKLVESEKKFRDIAELLPQVIFETDLHGELTYVNRLGFTMFGYSFDDDQMKKVNILELIAPQDRKKAIERAAWIIDGHRGSGTEFIGQRKNGEQFPVIVYAAPILEDDKIRGMRGTLIDMTIRKKLEAELLHAQKMEAIGTLAGGIAHDFNNLLSGIVGQASLIEMDPMVTSDQIERVEKIEESVRMASLLTNQLLGYARKGQYKVLTTNMNELLEKTADMFGRTSKDITIYKRFSDSLIPVNVDRAQITSVFMNLFVNAMQAMPGGGKLFIDTSNVSIREDESARTNMIPGSYVKISVTDNGVGMDEATRLRIFEPFFTTKEMGRGTGLGLAMVYGIVSGHKGYSHVYSEEGHGTTFSIYLPASEGKIVADVETSHKALARGSETILLVDDEELVINFMKDVLQKLGYKVFAAQNGHTAIQFYEEKRDDIDLVILDLIMPGMGGKGTFVRLREINPDVKVILSGGYSINGVATEVMDKGCQAFIQKPFTAREISHKIREILDQT